MEKKLKSNYNKFSKLKNKKTKLNNFFNLFVKESVYRNTKIEHPSLKRKDVFSILK